MQLSTREVMTSDMQNVDACSIRALCHYQMDNMDKCLQFFKGALQRNPDAEQPKRLYKVRYSLTNITLTTEALNNS